MSERHIGPLLVKAESAGTWGGSQDASAGVVSPCLQPASAPVRASTRAARPPAQVVEGIQSFEVATLPPGGDALVCVRCLALARGVQRLPALSVAEDPLGGAAAGRPLDTALPVDVLVI